ncbi:MoaD/ThiS family protein [Paracoccaceae bacterium]|nr:MoaD/ThiS family protein [Paracoccaceae bacterium]|tara:strand:+ start:2928 stop:3173 length:246 start_codon:yes stop_codon:yes gene_type:complete
MAEVNLWSGLRQFTDGELVIKVKADTVGKMLDELIFIYPNLEPIIEAGVSVAVDGEMIAGANHTPIKPDSEIFILQQFKGG